jgi:hypothetical protein
MCIITLHINTYKLVTIARKKKTLQKHPFHAKIKVPIVKISYMGYFKLYYVLLELRKVVIFVCFNVTIYINFELLNY